MNVLLVFDGLIFQWSKEFPVLLSRVIHKLSDQGNALVYRIEKKSIAISRKGHRMPHSHCR